jgi:colicin import membrane protein
MREMAFAKRLSATVSSAALFILVGGCSLEAEGDSAAHALADKFAKEATHSDSQKPQRAVKGKTVDRNARTGEQRPNADEDDMLARARAEAEQRREEMLKERAAAEQADLDKKAEEQKRLEQARRDEEERALAQQKADDERRLAAVRKAEEEARSAEIARQAELARKAEEERRLAEARRAEEQARVAEEARRAEAQRRADEERRIAEKLRADEEARVAEALRQAERLRQAEFERRVAQQKAEEAQKRAEAQRLADEANRRARLEAERDLEGQRLADRLRQAREEREAREIARMALGGPDTAPPVEQRSSEPRAEKEATGPATPYSAPPAQDLREAGRVAVLLLMEPGDRGIRRNNKSADPVLCGYDDCYVSNGSSHAASMYSSRRALGFFRTWGQRAGACNNSLGCVFRDVDLESLERQVMPVDMRVVRHDRREMQHISATSDCGLEGGRLACRTDVRSDDYVMWIVPESLAEKAGPAALERALAEGLHMSARTALGPSSLR